MDGPYVCADGTPCTTPPAFACGQGGACGHRPARGAIEAVGRLFHHRPQAPQGGPPVGTVTYPYYTIRGPRDFLAADPPSIGP